MPFLSVIVPIYNAENYLEECLDSIINQTYKEFELILVNDGSTDRSPQICCDYADKYSNVRVINKSNGGLVSARKAGLEVATGEYIGWVDADDCIVSEMFAKMCEEVKTTGADIVICDMWSWSGENLSPMQQAIKEGGVYKGEKLRNEFYPYMLYADEFYSFGILPAQFNKIIKASIIKRNMSKVDDRITIGEDAACTYFCMLEAESISYLKGQYLYKYRANLNSMCFQWKEEKIASASVLLNFFYNRSKEYEIPKFMKQFWYYFVCIYSNVYFEYGVYAIATHKKVQFINNKISLDNELEKEMIKQINDTPLNLPFDRKLVMQVELCGCMEKKHLAQCVIKLRCFLMYMYRKYKRK